MFIGIIPILMGSLIIAGMRALSKPADYSNWVEAEGVVEGVLTRSWIHNEYRTTPARLIVNFEMDGKAIQGQSNGIGLEKNIKEVIAKYPVGSKVRFKYNPNDKKLLSQVAREWNFQKYIYVSDDEFPKDSADKWVPLAGYCFGMLFVLSGIILLFS